MTAAQRESRPAGETAEAADRDGNAAPAYDRPGGKASTPKWFEGRQRRKIDPIGSSAIDWPVDLARRHQVHRDWHTIAMRRAHAAGIATEVLATFWRFVNLSEAAGTLWPSNDLLADISGVSLKTVTRQVAALEALGVIRTRRRWIGRNGSKQQVREIELTFPADLSRADFAGIAFAQSDWRRYLKDDIPKSDEAMRGPVTDDVSPETDEATHGPVSAECPPPSDGTMGNATDGTIPGPGTVERTVEGEGVPPSPLQSTNSSSNRKSSLDEDDARLERASSDEYSIGDIIHLNVPGDCTILKIGIDPLTGNQYLAVSRGADRSSLIVIPVENDGTPCIEEAWLASEDERLVDEIGWRDGTEIISPAPKTRRRRDAAA